MPQQQDIVEQPSLLRKKERNNKRIKMTKKTAKATNWITRRGKMMAIPQLQSMADQNIRYD